MIKKVKCPNSECGHAMYYDYEHRTCTPQPLCPQCMKTMLVPQPWKDGSGDEAEEAY